MFRDLHTSCLYYAVFNCYGFYLKGQALLLEKCQTCRNDIPMQSLVQHFEQCSRQNQQPDTGCQAEEAPCTSQSLANVQADVTPQILTATVTDTESTSVCTYSLQDILQMLQRNLDMDEVVRFNINRKNVWDGAVRAMRRPNFSARKRIDVKFTDDEGNSEGAVDMGGPMREFFRLAFQHIRQSPMFTGSDYERVLECHMCSLKENSYFYAGQLIAMSIVQGGPSPHFFAPVLYQAIVSGAESVQADIEDIHDHEIKSLLSEVGEEHV
nr:G2/M phase-specific E3 ubiquitin-protein ligase-like isoform X2 [Paramormyrops kingsleyae]